MDVKKAGILVLVIFLVSIAGSVSAATLDLPKWVIISEDALNFADVTLFCPLDAYDAMNDMTLCYVGGEATSVSIDTTKVQLVQGKIGNAIRTALPNKISITVDSSVQDGLTILAWVRVDKLDTTVLECPNFIKLVFDDDSYIWLEFNSKTGELRAGYRTPDEIKKCLTTYETSTEFRFVRITAEKSTGVLKLAFDENNVYELSGLQFTWTGISSVVLFSGEKNAEEMTLDEVRIYDRILRDDEIKLLYLAGRKKLSEPANFRQISSPFIDISRDRATFYAGLEVSTTDPNGYVPVPESAVNMTITSAPKLTSDYTGLPFYYQGHYWYRADKIQFDLPIQFETVREKGGFPKTVLLDEDKKTFVYEKEFKVTNPTATRLNVVYSVDPISLGFSVLQYPQFEIDGVRMAEWRPSNSSTLYLISTDSLEPGEISTHWIRSVWTITKEELEFPAKLDDFISITDWTVAQKMAENAIKGKTDTYVKVIKIDSNADVSDVTVLVPLNVEDEDDVIEAVALTGSRETLQVERLDDGKIVVKVPADAFVSGHAEIKVLYNKSDSWFSNLLGKIRSLMRKILSLFGLGGG